jgi:hypothetical protein
MVAHSYKVSTEELRQNKTKERKEKKHIDEE